MKGKITSDIWIMHTLIDNGIGHRCNIVPWNWINLSIWGLFQYILKTLVFRYLLYISHFLNLVREQCSTSFLGSLLMELLLTLNILFFISTINLLHLSQFRLEEDCLKVKRYKVFPSNYFITSSDLQITFNICLGQNYKSAQCCGQEDSSGTINLINSEIKSQLSLHFYNPRRKLKNTLVGLTKW